jgi:hypothetical protein
LGRSGQKKRESEGRVTGGEKERKGKRRSEDEEEGLSCRLVRRQEDRRGRGEKKEEVEVDKERSEQNGRLAVKVIGSGRYTLGYWGNSCEVLALPVG